MVNEDTQKQVSGKSSKAELDKPTLKEKINWIKLYFNITHKTHIKVFNKFVSSVRQETAKQTAFFLKEEKPRLKKEIYKLTTKEFNRRVLNESPTEWVIGLTIDRIIKEIEANRSKVRGER